MEQYKTIYVSERLSNEIIQGLASLGWKLHSIVNMGRPKRDDTIGPYDEDEEVLTMMTFVINLPDTDLYEIVDLTNDYLKLKDKRLRGLGRGLGGFIFLSIACTISVLIMLILMIVKNPTANIVGLIGLFIFVPGIAMSIFGIVVRSRALPSEEKEVDEKMNEIKQEIHNHINSK